MDVPPGRKVPPVEPAFQIAQLLRRPGMGRSGHHRPGPGPGDGGKGRAPGSPSGVNPQKSRGAQGRRIFGGAAGRAAQRRVVRHLGNRQSPVQPAGSTEKGRDPGGSTGASRIPAEGGAVQRDPVHQQPAAHQRSTRPGKSGDEKKRAREFSGPEKSVGLGPQGPPERGIDFFVETDGAPSAEGSHRGTHLGRRPGGGVVAGIGVDHPGPNAGTGTIAGAGVELHRPPPVGQGQGGVARAGEIIGDDAETSGARAIRPGAADRRRSMGESILLRRRPGGGEDGIGRRPPGQRFPRRRGPRREAPRRLRSCSERPGRIRR